MARSESPSMPDEGFVILLDDAQDDVHCVALRRDCRISEVAAIRQRLLAELGSQPRVSVDLGAVSHVDTAFLQLLASLSMEATARDIDLTFDNCTPSLLKTAEALGLSAVLVGE